MLASPKGLQRAPWPLKWMIVGWSSLRLSPQARMVMADKLARIN
jgi:hypothetical protein